MVRLALILAAAGGWGSTELRLVFPGPPPAEALEAAVFVFRLEDGQPTQEVFRFAGKRADLPREIRLPPGRYAGLCAVPGFALAFTGVFTVPAKNHTVVCHMEPLRPLTGRAVTREGQKPWPGAQVCMAGAHPQACAQRYPPLVCEYLARSHCTTSGRDGSFTLGWPQSKTGDLVVFAPGAATKLVKVRQGVSDLGPIGLTAGGEVTFLLGEGCSRAQLEPFFVPEQSALPPWLLQTPPFSSNATLSGLPEGLYWARCAENADPCGKKLIVVTPPLTANVELSTEKLEAALSVRLSGCTPPQKAELEARCPGEAHAVPGVFEDDKDISFSLSLPPGSYPLRLELEWQDESLFLELPALSVKTGHRQKATFDVAFHKLFLEKSSFSKTCTVEFEGEDFGGTCQKPMENCVVPGTPSFVWAWCPERTQSFAIAPVSPDGKVGSFVEHPLVTVCGQAWREDGSPAAGVPVHFVPEKGPAFPRGHPGTPTDEDGNFCFSAPDRLAGWLVASHKGMSALVFWKTSWRQQASLVLETAGAVIVQSKLGREPKLETPDGHIPQRVLLFLQSMASQPLGNWQIGAYLLPPGRYRLHQPGKTTSPSWFTLQPGQLSFSP